MNNSADKIPTGRKTSLVNADSQKESGGEFTLQFSDNRPTALAQRELKNAANNTPEATQLKGFQDQIQNSDVQANRGVVQRAIDISTSGMAQTQIPPSKKFTGLPPSANKTVDKVDKTTSPADPPGMSKWKDLGYLGDPSKTKKQALTRMHAIRGKFGGPSASNNMFLGTALSNNFDSKSHYSKVEKPLEDYLKGGGSGEKRFFEYTVTPNYGQVPQYMLNRINDPNEVDPMHQNSLMAFAQQHIPDGFTCIADLYRTIGTQTEHKITSETVATDVGASAGNPASIPVVNQAHASASESGILPGIGYGALGAAVGLGVGTMLGGPLGWAVALGVIAGGYGYATAEDD